MGAYSPMTNIDMHVLLYISQIVEVSRMDVTIIVDQNFQMLCKSVQNEIYSRISSKVSILITR